MRPHRYDRFIHVIESWSTVEIETQTKYSIHGTSVIRAPRSHPYRTEGGHSPRPRELAATAFALYESFRPAAPEGVRGWGAKGVLDLRKIRSLAKG